MKQIVCDACGSVVKNQVNQQYNAWNTISSEGAISVTLENLDICESCWNKIKQKGAANR